MSKIWSVGGNLYMSEKNALKAASSPELGYNPKVEIYTVSQVYNTTTDFVSELKRDKQLRAVLGELSDKEIKELNYKSNVESFITVMEKINFESYCIEYIKENKNKPTTVLNFIKDNKASFLSNSKDLEYYKALIKLTGFSRLSKKEYQTVYFSNGYSENKENSDVKPAYKGARYGYRCIEKVNLDESYHNSFKQAKKELKMK
jgi:hypothetical protein